MVAAVVAAFVAGAIAIALLQGSEYESTAAVQGAGSLDGVSIDYPDWHFNVRPSNTEPLLRLNLESLVSQAHMEEKRDEVLALIRS